MNMRSIDLSTRPWTWQMRGWYALHVWVNRYAHWRSGTPVAEPPSPLESLQPLATGEAYQRELAEFERDYAAGLPKFKAQQQAFAAECARQYEALVAERAARGPRRVGRPWYWRLNDWCADGWLPAHQPPAQRADVPYQPLSYGKH